MTRRRAHTDEAEHIMRAVVDHDRRQGMGLCQAIASCPVRALSLTRS